MKVNEFFGVYVHETRATPYAVAIASGIKPIETRTRDTLGNLVGEKVLIIRTRDGKPSDVVGSAVISEKCFCSAAELDSMRNQTLIPPGSKFDCNGKGKWCYTMKDPVLFENPILLKHFNIIRKTRSFAVLSV